MRFSILVVRGLVHSSSARAKPFGKSVELVHGLLYLRNPMMVHRRTDLLWMTFNEDSFYGVLIVDRAVEYRVVLKCLSVQNIRSLMQLCAVCNVLY